MKIETVFDETRIHDANYLGEWVYAFCVQCSKRKIYKDESQESVIEDVLNTKLPLDYKDPFGWRPYLVNCYTGYEDGGPRAYIVVGIGKEDLRRKEYNDDTSLIEGCSVYIRKNGFYASYDGTNWEDNWSFVKPKVFTKTLVSYD